MGNDSGDNIPRVRIIVCCVLILFGFLRALCVTSPFTNGGQTEETGEGSYAVTVPIEGRAETIDDLLEEKGVPQFLLKKLVFDPKKIGVREFSPVEKDVLESEGPGFFKGRVLLYCDETTRALIRSSKRMDETLLPEDRLNQLSVLRDSPLRFVGIGRDGTVGYEIVLLGAVKLSERSCEE